MNGLGNKEGWMQGANFNGPYTGQIPTGQIHEFALYAGMGFAFIGETH